MATRRLTVSTIFMVMVLLYAGMQLYAVARVHAVLEFGWPVTGALIAWVALMTFMPMLVWRWEARGWHRPVIIGSWLGYTWMGLAFLFFWIGVGLSIIETLIALVDPMYLYSPRGGFALAGILACAAALYGFFDARRPRIEKVSLTTAKLPSDSAPLRIAVISDVHLGAIVHTRRLRRILERLSAIDPDVLISAGDLVDGQADRLNGLAKMLADFRPRLGKYAVTGNHEYFVGLGRALRFHEDAGFTMLRGAATEITEHFTIAGVDDPTGRRMDQPVHTDEPALFAPLDPARFTLLVKHQPLIDEAAADKFDLQVSGHVHRGQIFPFGLLVRMRYPVDTGLTRLPDGPWLYVSRGTGTWGPPIRVGATPEITLIELRPAG